MKDNTKRFSDRVENYVKFRPGYPKEIIAFLEKSTGLNVDSKVADIATGGWEISAKFKLEHIGIDMEGIGFSNSDHYKSKEKITLNTINQLARIINEPIERIIYFGDGEWDYKTCKNLGIEFIGIDVQNDGKLKKTRSNNCFYRLH